MRTILRGVLTLLATLTVARLADAQGTARSLDIDTSIRAAGMGGASAGVWWGEPGVWGNAASLAEVHGIGWVDGRSQLVPGLAPDVWFKSSRLLLGGAGVGLSLMGEPIEGLGRLRLDYGEETGPFALPGDFEQTEAWGIGVSPIQLYDAIRHTQGAPIATQPRRVDVAGGFQHKHTTVSVGSPLTAPEADCVDWGVSARVALTPDLSGNAPFHLELSGGYAVLNANDAQFDFDFDSAPPSRIRRGGLALHGSIPSPWSADGKAPMLWLLSGEPRVVELGLAQDWEHIDAGGGPPEYDVERFGMELTLLGMLTGRIGHETDRAGEIIGNTGGFGARLPIGPWASVAYDYASIPQAKDSGLPNVKRQGWSAWVYPVRIWTDAHAKR
jgi:hypothetical protein